MAFIHIAARWGTVLMSVILSCLSLPLLCFWMKYRQLSNAFVLPNMRLLFSISPFPFQIFQEFSYVTFFDCSIFSIFCFLFFSANVSSVFKIFSGFFFLSSVLEFFQLLFKSSFILIV